MMMHVEQTTEARGAPACPGDPAERLVALRGELWQRHTRLQTVDREEARYDEQSDALIELTAELLRVEAEVAEAGRAARRRVGRIGFAVATVLLFAAVGSFLAAPVLGTHASRIGAGAALAAVVVVLAITALVRSRYWPGLLSRAMRRRPTSPEPSPGRATDAESDPQPARE